MGGPLQLPPGGDNAARGGRGGRRGRGEIAVMPPNAEGHRGGNIGPVRQQQVAIPARVTDVLVRPPAPTPPALLRDERPLAIDVEPRKGYDPVKVGMGVGLGGIALAGLVGIGVALSGKGNTTVYNITAAPAPIVAAAPPLPAPAPTVLAAAAPAPAGVTLGTPKAKEGGTGIEYNPQRDPTELYGLNLGTNLTAAGCLAPMSHIGK